MRPGVLFLITSDPRNSPRPAEAVRIAAGVASAEQAQVSLCLHGPAALALSIPGEDLRDGEHFDRYLPLIRERNCPVFISPASVQGLATDQGPVDPQTITDAQLAELLARADYVLHF